MRGKIFNKLSLVFIFTMLLIPLGFANGETKEVNNGKPYIKVYDSKNNLVKSYSDKEIQVLMEEAKESNLLLEPKVADGKPYAHTYDENNFLVDSNVEGIVETQQDALAKVADAYSVYNYEPTSFKSDIFVKNRAYFYNPTDITINAKQKFKGMIIKLTKQGETTESGNIKIGNFNGGIQVPFSELLISSENYTIEFINVNENDETINLDAGTVYYNNK